MPNEGACTTTANAPDKTTEACISALRNAMLASAGSCGIAPGEHLESLPCRTSPSWTGDGRAPGRGAVAGGSDNPEAGLKALDGFVHDTAMLEGVVEGVERGRGRGGTAALRTDGGTAEEEGVFVKVSDPRNRRHVGLREYHVQRNVVVVAAASAILYKTAYPLPG